MHWLDGISLDENLISGGYSSCSNENGSSQKKKEVRQTAGKASKLPASRRLDRKSSRGMIFENEELRLRTININAEVERGQTDIKRLRRENEQLRREIWTLRDECDRLNKKFKAKILDHDHGNCNVRGSGGGSSGRTRCPSQSNSDDSDSCDTWKGYDGHCSDDCCQVALVKQNSDVISAKSNSNIDAVYPKFSEPQHLHNTFDHLSVVSEETLSNSDVQAAARLQNELQIQQQHQQHAHSTNVNGSQTPMPGLFGQLTPLTPIELVANQINDLQATVPPLSYFENIVQQHMGSTIGTSPETANMPPNGKAVKHTNGWDYNIQSPFAQRKPSNSLQSSEPAHRSSTAKQRSAASPAMLSTFASTSSSPPEIIYAEVDKRTNQRNVESTPKAVAAPSTLASKIETVAITTMPTTAPPPSPKHFFSPLKPRLKINTALANKNASIPTPPIVPTTTTTAPETSTTVTTSKEHQNCDPPDIFVTNALASPYKRPSLPYQSSPQLPQRSTSSSGNSHVSLRQCQHHYRRHQHQYHLLQHQQHQQQQREKNLLRQHDNEMVRRSISPVLAVDVSRSDFDDDVDGDGYGDADTEADGAVDDKAADISSPANIEIASLTDTSSTENAIGAQSPFALLEIEKSNAVCLPSLPGEPIYAIAQDSSLNLISAPALTKPLMTATIDSPSKVSIAIIRSRNNSESALSFRRENQVESVNLESILNDIEHISEDILAIQLEKTKPRDVQNGTSESSLKEEDKNKKPYRSEMNLLLSYNGVNPTITPTSVTSSSHSSGDTVLRSRARSLERETTDTPSPSIPDAMPAFPDSRYVGMDKPGSQKLSNGSGSKSVTSSPKKLAPKPPIRLYPSQLSKHKSNPLVNGSTTPPQGTATTAFGAHGLMPNKSHLFKALANAAAKRGQFRLNSPVFSKSLDTDLPAMEDDSPAAVMSSSTDKALNNAEALNRKMRRVSIVCGDSPETPDVSPTTAVLPSQSDVCTPVYQLSTGSCTNLTSTPTNPLLQNLKQITCHSTPNSPHSVRRRNDSSAFTPSRDETNLPHSSNNGSQCRRSSQDSMRGNAQEAITASIYPTAIRSKCSRRNSEGTVVNNAHRTSGGSGHHHHHHHHHQHSSSTIANGRPHHSHISPQDNQETGSISDRNSSSFASSRDSSTSFSMRSQRRKISVSSHTGGKIPWCGCWGNGCL